jgi:hypothetical protein
MSQAEELSYSQRYQRRINKGGEGPISVSEGRADGVSIRVANLTDAAAFMAVRLSSSWRVSMPTAFDVRARVVSPVGDEKMEVVSPRLFTPNYQRFLRSAGDEALLTAQMEEYENEVFDRGLAWVTLSESEPSDFVFGVIREHGLSEEDLLARISAVPTKVAAYLRGVVSNNPVPIYS